MVRLQAFLKNRKVLFYRLLLVMKHTQLYPLQINGAVKPWVLGPRSCKGAKGSPQVRPARAAAIVDHNCSENSSKLKDVRDFVGGSGAAPCWKLSSFSQEKDTPKGMFGCCGFGRSRFHRDP